jgi:hypothetical protein
VDEEVLDVAAATEVGAAEDQDVEVARTMTRNGE